MDKKTKVKAKNGKQNILVTREFDLPVELLFKAHTEPALVEKWMRTTVLKLESKRHGSYQFETTDNQGKPVFQANGTIHEYIPNKKITRTFEMVNASFPVRLEFLEFEELTDKAAKLNMHMIFRTVADRNQQLELPFAQGLNMAHNRLQDIVSKLKANT